LVSQADGQESEAAQKAFREALKRDPKAIFARLHLARAKQQGGDPTGAKAIIQSVMADVPPADPRRPNLDQAVQEILTPQPALAGPAMNGDQMAMIRSMVSGLAAKLKSNPDDPEGWVRIVRSYSVLGDTKARDAALRDARARYRERADVLSQLDAAAKAEPLQ
jgi:cytochrome c-type biogenesis protein CcmH